MKPTIIYTQETAFGTIQVENCNEGVQPYRRLLVNGASESALFCDPQVRDILLFPYMEYFDRAASLRPRAESALLLGGGGFAYPWHLLSVFPGMDLIVVERYPEILRVAKEFFWLDELTEKYKDRLRIVTGDGFQWLGRQTEHGRNEPASYDLIYNDAFVGEKRIGRAGKETMCIKTCLSADGIYVVNMTSARRGVWSLHGRSFTRMLRQHFSYVRIDVCEKDRDPRDAQNLVVMASDGFIN